MKREGKGNFTYTRSPLDITFQLAWTLLAVAGGQKSDFHWEDH